MATNVTRKAIIQGDWHGSQRDARALFDRRTENTDALFVEGRSDVIRLEYYTIGYILFLLGYLSLEVILRTSSWLHGIAPGGEEWAIEDAGRNAGLDVNSEIDAELDEVWELAEGRSRTVCYVITLLLFAFAVLSSMTSSSATGLPGGLASVIIAVSSPFVFSALIILLLARNDVRDEIMAESIIDSCKNEEYSHVLVLCGDKHVSGISERLREEGWAVDDERSIHPLSSVSRILWKD